MKGLLEWPKLLSIFLVFFSTTLVLVYLESLPQILNATDADERNDFPGRNSIEILNRISQSSHSKNTAEHYDLYRYLYDRLSSIDRVKMAQPYYNITTNPSVLGNEKYVTNTRIIAYLQGLTNSTVVLSCHYDSRPTSFGTYDDGIATAISVTLMQMLASKPQTRNSFLLYINSDEEYSITGSDTLVELYGNQLKTVVNLEGGGVGGAAILFRSSSDYLSQLYANSVKYPHMNNVGGSLMLGSFTEYDRFLKNGIPGLDIAFYKNKKYYHTPNDNLDNLDLGSVQQMGSNSLKIVKALLNDSNIDTISIGSTSPFFDHFRMFGVVVTPLFRFTVSIAVFLWGVGLFLTMYWKELKSGKLTSLFIGHYVYVLDSMVASFGYSLIATAVGFFVLMLPYRSVFSLICPLVLFAGSTGAARVAIKWKHSKKLQTEEDEDVVYQHRPIVLLTSIGLLGSSIFALVGMINLPLLYLFPLIASAQLVTYTIIYVLPDTFRQHYHILVYILSVFGSLFYPVVLITSISNCILSIGLSAVVPFGSIMAVLLGPILLPLFAQLKYDIAAFRILVSVTIIVLLVGVAGYIFAK